MAVGRAMELHENSSSAEDGEVAEFLRELGQQLMDEYDVGRKTSCSTCHR